MQRQIKSGKYGSIEEALLAGMQLLEQQQQAAEADIYQGRLPQLQRAAQIGWEASQRGSVSKSEQIREVHTVMPGELQSLPPLAGYLTISDGTPAARVTIEAQGYGKGVKRFVAIDKKALISPEILDA